METKAPVQVQTERKIPSTSKRRSSKFHFRTGSLHKNNVSNNSFSINSFNLQANSSSCKKISKKFDFKKLLNKKLKLNSNNKNLVNKMKEGSLSVD